MELSQGLAGRILDEAKSDSQGIRLMFRLCLAREPSTAESQRLEQYLAQQLKECEVRPSDARALVFGDAKANGPEIPDLPRRAAWITLARVLLNLDEFITRE
jgi:hypothetical protein